MLSPEDAITRKELCKLFNAHLKKNGAEKDRVSICKMGKKLAGRHGLKEYPNPANKNEVLYSRKAALKVWHDLKPINAAA